MKRALQNLLNSLDKIASEHKEIYDTVVREEIGYAIYESFVIGTTDFQLPQKFGMFTDEANEQIYSVLLQFLTDPEVTDTQSQLLTPEERLVAFQNPNIKSIVGTTYEDFFGHTDIS